MQLLRDVSILTFIALAGGAAPLLFRRSDRVLHLLVALATGFFLGVVFLDLMPEVARLAGAAESAEHAQHAEHAEHAAGIELAGPVATFHTHSYLWLCVLAGVVGLFVLQNVVLKSGGHAHHVALHERHAHGHDHGHDAQQDSDERGRADLLRHVALGYASLIGLAVHSFTAGLGLAAAQGQEGLGEALLYSILSHKATESFSLTTVFLLAGLSKRRIFALGLFFALTTPAGLVLGHWAMDGVGSEAMAVLVALAAGTFLYVAIGDLLPEVFHNRLDALPRLLLVAGGVVVSMLLHGVGP